MENVKKLGLGIVCFDATEHLYNIISEIRDQVDYVVVGLQKVSYHGSKISMRDYQEVVRLRDEDHLVDKIIELDLDISKKAREQEVDKRNMLIQDCQDNGCSHALIIDSDEFYPHDSFKKAVEKIDKENIPITYCQYLNYWKDYKHYLVYPFNRGMHVPFVTRVEYRHAFECQDFDLPSDPTRRFVRPAKLSSIKITKDGKQYREKVYEVENYVFPWNELKMHHLSWVRENIRKKLNNWSSKKLFPDFEDLIDKSVDKFEHFGEPGYEDMKQAELLFNTPGHKVDIADLPRQFIFPKVDINTRLRDYPCEKKILVLVLSTNNTFTNKMEDAIRSTWFKSCSDSIEKFFISECKNPDEKDHIEGDTIYINCNQDFQETYYKFYRSLKLLKDLGHDFDYLVRTNTSTWVNIEAVKQFIYSLDEDACNYAGALVSCPQVHNRLYMQGNAFILPKRSCEFILSLGHVSSSKKRVGTDDYIASLVLSSRYEKLGIDYTHNFKSIGIFNFKKDFIDSALEKDLFSKYMFVQIKNFEDIDGNVIDGLDYENRSSEYDKMIAVNDAFLEMTENCRENFCKETAMNVKANMNNHIVIGALSEREPVCGYNGWQVEDAIIKSMADYKAFMKERSN